MSRRTHTLTPRLTLFAGASLAVTLLTACGSSTSGDPDTTIAAGFYPLQYVAERVAGPDYTVENLTTPGAEPHDLELGIRETAVLSNAALVVYERGFQPAVDTSVSENAEGATLDAASVVDLEPLATGEEPDPHFWQDPLRVADLGDAVAEQLADLDPDRSRLFTDNAQSLREDLEALDREYAAGLADCERDTVVVNHDAFGYLEKYGLDLQSILGLSPDAEPTAEDLRRIKDIVVTDGLTTVFSETLVSAKVTETLGSDLGVDAAVLDPLEGLTEDDGTADYLSVMRKNLAALQQANGCR